MDEIETEVVELVDGSHSTCLSMDDLECVYFLHAMGTDLVKVGWTRSLPHRIRSLSTGCPHKLRLLAIIPGSIEQELELHRSLAPYRKNGEWFELTHPVREWLRCFLRATHWAVWKEMREHVTECGLWPDPE